VREFNRGAKPERKFEKPAVLGPDAEVSDHGADTAKTNATDVVTVPRRRATRPRDFI
jgi:hypothetical protein